MTRKEIEAYLDVCGGYFAVVDVREVAEAPGTVRTVTVWKEGAVRIEYLGARAYVSGSDEGGVGLTYKAAYRSLGDALDALCVYLGAEVEAWANYRQTPLVPRVLDDVNPEKTRLYFEGLVRDGRVALPAGARFVLTDVYWRHIAKFGRYRKDKLLEEQDEFLEEEEAFRRSAEKAGS